MHFRSFERVSIPTENDIKRKIPVTRSATAEICAVCVMILCLHSIVIVIVIVLSTRTHVRLLKFTMGLEKNKEQYEKIRVNLVRCAGASFVSQMFPDTGILFVLYKMRL